MMNFRLDREVDLIVCFNKKYFLWVVIFLIWVNLILFVLEGCLGSLGLGIILLWLEWVWGKLLCWYSLVKVFEIVKIIFVLFNFCFK